MTLAEAVVSTHRSRDGALCWGGPEHGRVVAIPDDRGAWLFPLETRFNYRIEADPSPIGPAFQTVLYHRRRFTWPQKHGLWHEWPVLIYAENSDYHVRGMEAAVRLIRWLCDPERAA